MKIAIGSDHAALDLKSTIVEHLKESGIDVTDLARTQLTPVIILI